LSAGGDHPNDRPETATNRPQAAGLDATLGAFAKACDYITDVVRREHTTNRTLIQRACYREVRAIFGLSANLAIRAIARVCTALKVPEKTHSTFKPKSQTS